MAMAVRASTKRLHAYIQISPYTRISPYITFSSECLRRPSFPHSLTPYDIPLSSSHATCSQGRHDSRGLMRIASSHFSFNSSSNNKHWNASGSFEKTSLALFASAFLLSNVTCESNVDQNVATNANTTKEAGNHSLTGQSANLNRGPISDSLQATPEEVKVSLPMDKLCCHRDSSNGKPRKEQVVLLCAGSFNPPTYMHLRMLELAREALIDEGYDVIGAYISPVNGAYKKPGLVASDHRVQMCQMAVQDSPFIMVDTWEAEQVVYKPTLFVLQRLDSALNPPSTPENEKVRPVLVCGADLLESFGIPGVWQPEQVKKILSNYGVVCITRKESDARTFIHSNDLLYENRKRVLIVDEWITNDISSTKLRLNISRGSSIRYLTHDSVIDYINKHSLYQRR